MADSDKIITITPNTSVATTHPEIKFVGKDNSPMYLRVLDDNSLSFEGAEGQVFSMSPTMSSGDIFSVSDISGIQNIAVNADGTITMNAQTQSTTIKNSASNTATLILENTNADAILASDATTNCRLSSPGVPKIIPPFRSTSRCVVDQSVTLETRESASKDTLILRNKSPSSSSAKSPRLKNQRI